MQRFVIGLLYLVSLLPLRVLYALSDVAAWVLHYIIRYRLHTVQSNLEQACPSKTTAERSRIVRRFYRHFTDNWVETIKLLSISPKAFNKRISGNFELFDELQAKGKPASMLTAHFYNWEWLNAALSLRQPMPFICVYMPITSPVVEALFRRIRGRFGAHLMPVPNLTKDIIAWRKKQYLIGLVADQSPSNPANAYWLNFLRKPTGFVTGPERNAQVFGQTPVYTSISCPRRGHYRFQFEVIELSEEALKEKGQLTLDLVRRIEADIQRQPALYLWSHRRWKHGWKADYAGQWIDTVAAPQ